MEFIHVIAPYASFIVVLGGAVTIIAKFVSKVKYPVKTTVARIKELEKHSHMDKERLNGFEIRLSHVERSVDDIVKMQLLMMSNVIDGNGKDKMKELREEVTRRIKI